MTESACFNNRNSFKNEPIPYNPFNTFRISARLWKSWLTSVNKVSPFHPAHDKLLTVVTFWTDEPGLQYLLGL